MIKSNHRINYLFRINFQVNAHFVSLPQITLESVLKIYFMYLHLNKISIILSITIVLSFTMQLSSQLGFLLCSNNNTNPAELKYLAPLNLTILINLSSILDSQWIIASLLCYVLIKNNYMNRQCLKHSQNQQSPYQSLSKTSKYHLPLYKNANFCTRRHSQRSSVNHHLKSITINHQNIAKYEDFDCQNSYLNLKEYIQPSIVYQSKLFNPAIIQINRGFQPNSRLNKTSNGRRSKSSNFRLVHRSQDKQKDTFTPSFCSTIVLNTRQNQRICKKIEKSQTIKDYSMPNFINEDKRQKTIPSRLKDMRKNGNKNSSIQQLLSNLNRKKQIMQRQHFKIIDNEIDLQPWCILQTQA